MIACYRLVIFILSWILYSHNKLFNGLKLLRINIIQLYNSV